MKREPLYKKYGERKPDAVIPFSNCGGIAIWYPDSGEGADLIAGYDFGHGPYKIARHTVFYSTAGRPFIRKGQERYYLDEMLKC